jgi:cytochrome c oxidase cbb3-type subunit III
MVSSRTLPLLLLALTAFAAPPDPKAVERGRKLFEPACGFCHGNDATGSRAPDLVRSPLLAHDTDGNGVGPVIKSGRVDKGMPAFPYTNAQISDVAAFLHKQAQLALASNHVPGDYPLAKLLTGNAAAGKAYFNGAGQCSTCHSPTGDLAGVARRYTPINLQAKFLYPDRARRSVTVILASGEKVSGTVARLDEFNVALRDGDGWYRSWPLNQVKIEVRDPLAKHRELLERYTDDDIHNLFAYLETLK